MKLYSIVLLLACFFTSLAPSNYQSAFGELITVEPTAIVQLQYPYGNLNPNYVLTTGANSGTVGTGGENFAVLNTGTGSDSGIALLRSKARLHYQPGQGCECLFTALFTTTGASGISGISGTSQQIGIGNMATGESGIAATTAIQDGFFFGFYNGTSVSYTGVTGSASPTGIPTGSGVLSGDTFGIIHTCNSRTYFYPQTSWNQYTCDGSAPYNFLLEPSKGNVYKLQYQWLGFGIIGFFIENPPTGSFVLVHTIQYANQNTITTLANPSLQLLAKVANVTGGSTGNVSLQNPSFAGLIQGQVNPQHNERMSVTSGVAGFTINTTIQSVLTIQNKSLFNSKPNNVEIFPTWLSILNTDSVNAEGIIRMYLNPTFAASLSYTDVDTANSVVQYSTTNTTVSGGTLLAAIYVRANSTQLFSLKDLKFQLEPNDILAITATTINGAQDPAIIASISWEEAF